MLNRNLSALININPELVARIMEIKENKKFEVFLDENDILNYNIYDVENDEIFYKTTPIQEVIAQYETIEKVYSRYPYLYFYGINNGVLYKLLLQKKNIEKIVIIEPNLELIYIVLNLLDFKEEIDNGRVIFEFSKDFSFIKADSYLEKNAKIFAKVFELHVIDNYYYRHYSSDITKVNRMFLRALHHVVSSIGNNSSDSLIGLKHQILNFPTMLKTPSFQDARHKFKNSEYAVIVSTGPSLYKQLELLKEYQDYVTIFCVDASLPILQEHRIKPDIVFSLERVEATAKFYENLDREFLKDTIFEVTSIAHKDLLKNLEGMKLQISMRPFNFLKYFGFNNWGYLGLGMSASNMAFEAAYLSYFKNIVFIGQDLAYSKDGKSHSKGHTFGEREVKQTDNNFLIEGYYGDEVITTKIWNLFLNFFEKHIQDVKEKGVKTYNCTEGGAKIRGAIQIPFRELLSMVDISKKKELIELEENSDSYDNNIKLASKKIEELLDYAKEKQQEIENTFVYIMQMIEKLELLNKENRLEEITFEMLNEAIFKIDAIKELYESEEFRSMFYESTMTFIIHEEMELAKIMVKNVNTDEEKKAKIVDWIYEHKSWLFFLAGGLESIRKLVQESYEEWD